MEKLWLYLQVVWFLDLAQGLANYSLQVKSDLQLFFFFVVVIVVVFFN